MRKLKAAEGDTTTTRAGGCLRVKIELIAKGSERYQESRTGWLVAPPKLPLRSTRNAPYKLQQLNGLTPAP